MPATALQMRPQATSHGSSLGLPTHATAHMPARAPASATAKASACAPRDLTERVFIAPNGIKCHTRFGCSGAIGDMLLTQARARGYSPCKKCT